ncbi:MAG: glycoside hydrolase family 97 protein [Candidatus Marinimicrobia bacterium]|nr:glycoside hydrolase family 97 protein [Candidatus Neomarinimicrobiota bacterium]
MILNRRNTVLGLFLVLIFFNQCKQGAEESIDVSSPDGKILVTFTIRGGVPHYQISRSGRDVIKASKLGFTFKDAAPLNRNLAVVGHRQSSFDEVWVQPWGEVKDIRNHYNQLHVQLAETTAAPRKMNLVFKVYDDGVGFRYELPAQEHLGAVQITDEQTQFKLAGDHKAWWIKAYQWNRYEYLYQSSAVSDIDTVVHTPLTMETRDGLYLSIHEAALTDYPSMTLAPTGRTVLECDLVPWWDGIKVKTETPFVTPWRTIQIAETAGDLITSYLILNLNEPNKLGDVSWVQPGKYVGIWWGMHIGTYTWESGEKHGATTANAKRYIDFAAEHGFPGVLIEGWNTGWDGDWIANSDLFNFTTPYDDFDMPVISAYAASKGVKIIGHHETSKGIANYERQVDDAFRYYRQNGINTIKTGYVGFGQNIVPVGDTSGAGEWHHGQYMVRHYRMIVEKAAENKIMLDVHEPIKPTGIRRTYPNMMTREGARGQEYNAWSDGNPPDHTTILPFTRLLGGPMDFTAGIFDLTFEAANRPGNRVSTTLAKQLALYVVIYSPLQMAADLVENYENQPAFQFIEDVPVDWQDTRVLHAQIGDYLTIARQDRNSADWYMGSITDELGRTLETQLTFLDADRQYVAEIYSDADDADWDTNPLAIDISRALVDRSTTLSIRLAPGGGQAIRIRPATEEETHSVTPY